MASMERTVSIGSISISSEEDEKSIYNKPTNNITSGFKYHWFDSTLKFVKNDRRMSQKHGVTPAQARFVRDVLNFEEKPSPQYRMFSPLYEALKLFGLRYKFKLSRVSKNAIVLQKIPRTESHFVEPESVTETISPVEQREPSVIDRISREFMLEKTQSLMRFVNDPSRASLVFANVSPLESNFLQSIMTAARPMFPEHKDILHYMNRLKPMLDFTLEVVVGRINRHNNQRTVTFKKVPSFGRRKKRGQQTSLNRLYASLNNLPSNDQPNSTQHNTDEYSTRRNSMDNEQNKINANSMRSGQNSMQVGSNAEMDSPRSGDSMNSSAISVQSEPVLVEDSGSRNYNYGSQYNLSRGDCPAVKPCKARLIADLSMPVQLEKPARMMEKMGWKGGPLGPRENGIPEPIMPVLNLVSGAGLGHSKQASGPVLRQMEQIPSLISEQRKKKIDDVQIEKPRRGNRQRFRLEILQNFLDLLESETPSVVIEYSHKLGKKEISFLRRAATSLSERLQMTDLTRAESYAEEKVLDILDEIPNILVHGIASECQRKITLRKVIIEWDIPNEKVITVDDLVALAENVENSKYRMQTVNVKRFVGVRITILIEILYFVQYSEMFRELIFEEPLTRQEKSYIMKTVEYLTERKKSPVHHTMRTEDEIYEEILNIIQDSIFTVTFDDDKPSLFLEKVEITYQNNKGTSKIKPAKRKNKDPGQNVFDGLVLHGNTMCFLTKKIIIDKIKNNKLHDFDTTSNIVVSVDKHKTKIVRDDGDSSLEGKVVLHGSKSPCICGKCESNDTHCSKNSNKAMGTTLDTVNTKTDEINGINDLLEYNDDISENGEVVIIENVPETIVISDDESSGASKDNAQQSNTLRSGENDITPSTDTISYSQDCTPALDTYIKSDTRITTEVSNAGVSDNHIARDIITNKEENVQINKTKDSIDKSIFNIEEQDIGVNVKSSIDNSELDITNNGTDEKEKSTDINKVIAEVEPKKEKLSYSDEFDKDLYDLEQLLLLEDDDDLLDYTEIKKEKDDSANKIERPSSKRSRLDSGESTPDNWKKTKIFSFNTSNNVLIVPKDYPEVIITKECAIKIQCMLLKALDTCNEMPLLKCHGIHNGGLVYSCNDEQSLFFIDSSMRTSDLDFKLINNVTVKNGPYSMKIKHSTLYYDNRTLFNLLELYNAGLMTDKWSVDETHTFDDQVVIYLDVDPTSYKYIRDNKFCLYAGIDEVMFSHDWD